MKAHGDFSEKGTGQRFSITPNSARVLQPSIEIGHSFVSTDIGKA